MRLRVANAKELDFVVAVELVVAQRGHVADLRRRRKLGNAGTGRLEVTGAERDERGEVFVGEEVDALDVVVVDEVRMDVRLRRGKGEVHFATRPDEGLDAPLLAEAAVPFEGAVGTLTFARAPVSAGATLVAEVGDSGVDKLVVGGDFDASSLALRLTALGSCKYAAGDLLVTSGALSGAFDPVTKPAKGCWTVSYGPNVAELRYAPRGTVVVVR